MSTTITSEWAALQSEEIVVIRDTRDAVLVELRRRGESAEDYDIVALPKAHGSLIL